MAELAAVVGLVAGTAADIAAAIAVATAQMWIDWELELAETEAKIRSHWN